MPWKNCPVSPHTGPNDRKSSRFRQSSATRSSHAPPPTDTHHATFVRDWSAMGGRISTTRTAVASGHPVDRATKRIS